MRLRNSSSGCMGWNPSSRNASSEFVFRAYIVFGVEFVFAKCALGVRLRGAIRLSGRTSSSRNASSEILFGVQFVFRGGRPLHGMRLRKSSSGCNSSSERKSSSGNTSSEFVFGVLLVSRGGHPLRGMHLRKSSSEFVFVCGWRSDTRTAATMWVFFSQCIQYKYTSGLYMSETMSE